LSPWFQEFVRDTEKAIAAMMIGRSCIERVAITRGVNSVAG
jgi:hypothetical protein